MDDATFDPIVLILDLVALIEQLSGVISAHPSLPG
jgi:hypothetical protein